ncbi:MAG: FISUMP domain-containing protein [Bacteroidota bacterium]|nr:FISUMP domain-containing protein [Bacteroidota bacterium]
MNSITSIARTLPLLFLILLYSCRKGDIPVVTTEQITNITPTSASTGGNVTSDGGSDITSRGICWNSNGNPTTANSRTSDGTGTGAFSSTLKLLRPGTYYYIRAYATNKAGTGYGEELGFATLEITTGTVSDIDGNIYKTVTIGSQTWMAENLKTKRYSDNTPVPLVTNGNIWKSLATPAYCWYKNDSSAYAATYGALYNWYAVVSGNLCPIGWRVPNDSQWTTMTTYLGGEYLAGDKLKEEGQAHWFNFNSNASNETGFTALPGGARMEGDFVYITMTGAWWSSTEYDSGTAWCRELDDNIIEMLVGHLAKSEGYSIRCIQD